MATVNDKAVLNAIFNPLLPGGAEVEDEEKLVQEEGKLLIMKKFT